ncbi:M23 family metallopeptidase [Acinetobacter qingfengensis]|uniref:Peptidase M23 n=1 Tax=Acinetobacter qingfengensis TaxID=1262585 RepID=A0A1E7QWI0_9GAMM|nr:M23 family metallopeptidase [Acinetobacter qingfengensis]KAA8731289.1 M23 family metallopeptidase [Acinetobacter qingfengensis]OEY91462.1 peptidase M23 [Acinetobacter qingfengensis]
MRFYQLLIALCASTAMSSSFADIQRTYISAGSSEDRLEQLSQTLSKNNTEESVEFTNASFSHGKNSSSSALGSWLTAHPIKNARVSSTWGNRTLLGSTRHHSGVDLAAPSGTPIYATGPGIVTKSGWGTGYGNYVEIDHGNGYVTRYAHASRLGVRVGERVSAGQMIANVGCTGRCTGPHLHFEVVKNGQRQNPSTYLAMLP